MRPLTCESHPSHDEIASLQGNPRGAVASLIGLIAPSHDETGPWPAETPPIAGLSHGFLSTRDPQASDLQFHASPASGGVRARGCVGARDPSGEGGPMTNETTEKTDAPTCFSYPECTGCGQTLWVEQSIAARKCPACAGTPSVLNSPPCPFTGDECVGMDPGEPGLCPDRVAGLR